MKLFILIGFVWVQLAQASSVYVGLDNVVPFEWHPAHGFFLKKNSILSHARLNGCYGSETAVKAMQKHLPMLTPAWRQSTFESYRSGDHLRRTDNTLSYPLDPIAAFIQWCYPSPGRTSLEANVNCADPLGVWARGVLSANPAEKEAALSVMGCIVQSIQDLYNEKVDSLKDKSQFYQGFSSLFSASNMPPHRIKAFADIVYEAVRVERFHPDIKTLYPEGMVRRTLLAYITDIVSTQADMVSIFKSATMIPDNFELSSSEPLTKASYQVLAKKVKGFGPLTITDIVNYRLGRKIYGNFIPTLIEIKRAVITVNDNNFAFANCGEVALLNYILIGLWDDGAIHPKYLDHLRDYPLIRAIQEHFQKYNTLDRLNAADAHNDWGRMVANKNRVSESNPLQRVKYNRGGVAELAGAMPSLLNLWDVFFTKEGESVSDIHIRNWETPDVSMQSDKSLVLEKWRLICEKLASPRCSKRIQMKTTETEKLGLESTIEFDVSSIETFSYESNNNHFLVRKENTDSDSNSRCTYQSRLPTFWQGDRILYPRTIHGPFANIHNDGYYNNQYFRDKMNSASPLISHLTKAIFFRMQDTYSHNRLDDDAVVSNVLLDLFDTSGIADNTELVRWCLSSQAGHDFIMMLYFPNALAHTYGFNAALVQELKVRTLFNGIVTGIRNGNHPRKWPFLSFYGDVKAFKSLIGNPASEAQSILNAPINDAQHPLCMAVRNGHLDVVKILTQQGKSAHWKTSSLARLLDRHILIALINSKDLIVVSFIAENDPSIFEIKNEDYDIATQETLAMAKTPEIFDYLAGFLNLQPKDYLSWQNPRTGEQETMLKCVMRESTPSVVRYLLEKHSDFPITREILERAMECLFAWKTYDAWGTVDFVMRDLIKRYEGDLKDLHYQGATLII